MIYHDQFLWYYGRFHSPTRMFIQNHIGNFSSLIRSNSLLPKGSFVLCIISAPLAVVARSCVRMTFVLIHSKDISYSVDTKGFGESFGTSYCTLLCGLNFEVQELLVPKLKIIQTQHQYFQIPVVEMEKESTNPLKGLPD